MPASDFIFVAKTSDLADPGTLLVEVDDRLIVLARVGSEYYAIDDICTHDGGPLSEGELSNHAIACPRHGAMFDLQTGAALTMPATQPTVAHEVKVEEDRIYLRIHN